MRTPRRGRKTRSDLFGNGLWRRSNSCRDASAGLGLGRALRAALDQFRENTTHFNALQLVAVTEQHNACVSRSRLHKRVHQGKIHHACLVDQNQFCIQRPAGVSAKRTAAFGGLRAPFECLVQCEGTQSAQEFGLLGRKAREVSQRLPD